MNKSKNYVLSQNLSKVVFFYQSVSKVCQRQVMQSWEDTKVLFSTKTSQCSQLSKIITNIGLRSVAVRELKFCSFTTTDPKEMKKFLWLKQRKIELFFSSGLTLLIKRSVVSGELRAHSSREKNWAARGHNNQKLNKTLYC